MSIKARYDAFCSIDRRYPVDFLYGVLQSDANNAVEFILGNQFDMDWGAPQHLHICEEIQTPLPSHLILQWLSLVEQKIYDVDLDLPLSYIEEMWETPESGGYCRIVAGLAPYGQVALWLQGPKKSSLVLWSRGKIHKWIDQNEESDIFIGTMTSYCTMVLSKHPEVMEGIRRNGMPPHDLFDQYMKQYTYRILPIFGRWDEVEEEWGDYGENEIAPRIAYIEAFHTDGTRDCTRTDFLMQYHEAGRPQKLALCWHIGKGEFNAYVWFDERRTFDLFEAFYATHPGVKASLLFHADPEANHYEWLLYSSDVIEPMLVAEDAYQMIVFRNRYEHYRTNNYNQPKGAWLW